MARASRSIWGWVTVVVVALMVAPVVFDHDSHPLSTYPMYSSARGREVTLPAALALTDQGTAERLSLGVIGASSDPLIVAGELRTAIRNGRAVERCAEIAARVDDPAVDAVAVVMERHDVIAQVEGEPSLRARTVYATCAREQR
ncbi:MAG: hypothetical protein ABWZ42_10780 [Ilumatobacteraceae bacterium]